MKTWRRRVGMAEFSEADNSKTLQCRSMNLTSLD